MTEKQFFQYDQSALDYLRSREPLLGREIDRIGWIEREIIPDLFAALVYSIVGQQISNKAAATVWMRMQDRFVEITPARLDMFSAEEIQKCGLSMRKAGYIKNIAGIIMRGEISLEALHSQPDQTVIEQLTRLPGIGVWTAEMLLIFSLQRPDILSWGDLAIRRGMITLYGEQQINKTSFEIYRQRYSPFGSIASLYLWQIAREN